MVAVAVVLCLTGVAASQLVGRLPDRQVVAASTAPDAAAVPPPQMIQERAQLVPRRRVVEAQEIERAPQAPRTPKRTRLRARAEAVVTQQPYDVRVGTFNVLGSQHTAPGGNRQKYPPASVRTAGTANLVAAHGVDVLGTQELQADQLRGLQSRTGMAAYPGFAWGEAETDNSVLWDPAVFDLVSGARFTINFMGRPRPQPIVRLRHRATGRELYVVNTHPSAGGGRYAAERANGRRTLVSVVNGLQGEGLPVLVTGDMNDREAFYCAAVPAAGLTASNGGSHGDGCSPPPSPLPVDWVVGSGVTWSGYWRDTTPVDRRISDHFFVSALAHVG